MSSTPKTVRRNRGYCICVPEPEWDTKLATVCRYGYCTDFRCPACRGKLGGWGPVACKCEGGPRWLRHPDMAPRGRWDLKADKLVREPVAVKPSLAKFKRDLAGFR